MVRDVKALAYWLMLKTGCLYLCRLRNVLEQDQFQHLDMEDHFSAEFPISITLDQTVAVWKHIVHYQKELKQE